MIMNNKNINENENVVVANTSIEESLHQAAIDYRNGFINPLDLVRVVGRAIAETRCGVKGFDKGINYALIGFADFLADVYAPDEDVHEEVEAQDVCDFSSDERVRMKYDGRGELSREIDKLKVCINNAYLM